MQEKRHDRVVEMRLCFFLGKVGDYNVSFVETRMCRSTIEYEQQWLGEIHFTCNLGVSQRKRKAPRKKRYAYWMEGFCRKYRISCSGQIYKKDRWER